MGGPRLSGVRWLRRLALASALAATGFAATACGGPKKLDPCTITFAPTVSGPLAMQYSGAAGTFAGRIPMWVSSSFDRGVDLHGCDYSGDDFWHIEFSVTLADLSTLPASFDNARDDRAHASAFLMRCEDGDPLDCHRTWFQSINVPATTEGTLERLDTANGRLTLDVTLHAEGPNTLETGPLRVSADLSWTVPAE